MKTPLNAVVQTLDVLLSTGSWKATKYLSDKLVVRAVRRLYGNKFDRYQTEIVLTIGRPNYAERALIKACKQAKEPFPVKKVLIKSVPKKK